MVAVTMDLANGQPVSDGPSLQTDRQQNWLRLEWDPHYVTFQIQHWC